MRKFILFVFAAVLAALVNPAFAGPVAVFKGSNVWVYAFNEPCGVPMLAQALVSYGPSKRAVVKVGEAMIPACYAVAGDKIIIIDADGDGGYIDASEFEELAMI